MAVWTTKANRDMQVLVQYESVAAVDSIRAPISQWADGVQARALRQFQEMLRVPVIATAQNGEIMSVEHD